MGAVALQAVGCRASLTGSAREDDKEELTESDKELIEKNPELFALAKKYFPGSESSAPSPRFYRLTRHQLDRTVESLLPGLLSERAVDVIPPDPRVRNYELAADLGIRANNFAPYRNWVDAVAAEVLETPELVVPCSSESAECLDASARAFVDGSFRGIAEEEVLDRFVEFFRAAVDEVGLPQAAADLASVVMTSPYFAFREEVRLDDGGSLLPEQALQNLTYTLADVPPSELGIDPARASEIVSSPETLRQTVSEILKSPLAREKLVRFFFAWLEIRGADQFDIDTNSYPVFTEAVAEGVVEETNRFLSAQLSAAAPRLSMLTESTESFVSEAIADIYGMDVSDDGSLVPLPSGERRGLFTHASFIASHSGPVDTRLVKRGAFFTKKVLCQELGDPPDGSIPTGVIPGDTERERIEGVTSKPSCIGCHQYINPFGFMMESYDAIGRFRTQDAHGFPIDSHVVADFLDEGKVDERRAVDALGRFTDSAMFRQCFVRQAFTFYTGRRPEKGDDPALREMFFRFSETSGGDLIQLLTMLATSSNFNARVPGE